MAVWRVRTGYSFGAQNQYGPGDLVALSDAEAAGFADKLEPAPGVRLPVESGADDLPVDWQDFGDLAPHLNMIRLLVANGYITPLAVQQASDTELLAIRGIGPKALGALRAVLGAA